MMDIELARVREDLRVEDYESAFSAAAELELRMCFQAYGPRIKPITMMNLVKICDLAAKYSLRVNLEFGPLQESHPWMKP